MKNSSGVNHKFHPNHRSRGVGLIELIIVIAIIGLVLASLGGLGSLVLKINQQNKKSATATFLAQEAIEASRAIKEESWDLIANLAIDTPLHPVKTESPLKWSLAAGTENINGLTRQITVGSVFRDANDDIIASGGTLDPGTKKITAAVAWTDNGRGYQSTIVYYLTNWRP